jgi:FkbM family methyltransferase
MKILERVARRLFFQGAQVAYSQFGEDLIIHHYFNERGVEHPTYLDIGANNPKFISNTFFFYRRGSRGVLVEPNPRLCKKLRTVRPRDRVLEVGIGFEAQSEADFFVFSRQADGLSTFSKNDAMHWQTVGMKGHGKIFIEKTIRVPLVPINDVIGANFHNGTVPNLLSLDIEGLDLAVLQSLDFERFAPEVVCVETLAYDDKQNGYKREDILQFMGEKNYAVHADTYVNTIFVRKKS